jgi:putative ABC transport system permease protein
VNDLDLVSKNLWRKPFRTTLLIISVTIAFLLFGLLNGFLDSINRSSEGNGAAERLVTLSKVNFTQPLPISYIDRIKAVEGVTDVTHASWFGGYFQETRNFIFSFAVDPESYVRIYNRDIVLPAEQSAAFVADRTGLIVGKDVADRYGWKVGDSIPLKSNIFTNKVSGDNTWQFTLSGIYTGSSPADTSSGVFFHWEYFNETKTFGIDTFGNATILTVDPARNGQIAEAIDAMFANSRAETATQDEAAFNRSFLQQQGDIAFIIRAVSLAAFFAILMIVGTTQIMAIRERTKEIGVLKTLGFSSPRVLGQVLGESLLVSLLGAAIGIGLVALIFMLVNGMKLGFFGVLSLSPEVLGISAAIAVGLGLVTGLVPALNALNLRIVDALGRK